MTAPGVIVVHFHKRLSFLAMLNECDQLEREKGTTRIMKDLRGKPLIVGQSRSLRDEEAVAIQEMILETQGSARQLTIPPDDLHQEATTEMDPEVERVIDESGLSQLLYFFNRDFLYGLGRFDVYRKGLLLKWGDGYSRKHIWVTVEENNLLQFATSHARNCGHDYCHDGLHIYPPELWHDLDVINNELAEQFQRPIYERSDD
jgi:hypothetical protein